MATPFLDRLRAASADLVQSFESGSPTVQRDIATSISGLYSTWGPYIDALPLNRANAARERFSRTIRLDDLRRALATSLGDEALYDNPRELMERAAAEGLFIKAGQDKNTLYRINAAQMGRWGDIVRDNSSTLRVGDDADDYLRYISDMNVNINEYGHFRVSPNQFLTHSAFERNKSAYAFGGRVWQPYDNMIAFDLETSGGLAHAADVNEVAAVGINTRGGLSTTGFDFRETFSVNRMTLGVYNDAGTARTLNWKFGPKVGSVAENVFTSVAADGDAFIKGVRPLLEQMAGADAILGQNIMGFDIDRLIGNVVRTSAYQNDESIQKLVGAIQGKMGNDGYIVDTLQMLGEYERHKGQSLTRSDLLPNGKGARSLENILLNTNLIDLMKDEFTDPNTGKSLWEMASTSIEGIGGHHTGRYDALVTSSLYRAMTTEQLEFHGSKLSVQEIKDIVTAKAYTPMTTITDPADITSGTFKNLIERAKTNPSALTIRSVTGGANADISGMNEKQIRALLTDPNYYLDTDINFIEQASIHTRNMARVGSATAEDTYDIVGRVGSAWRNITGLNTPYEGTLNATGSIFKHGTGFDLDEFTAYQKSISGLPFSHIGLPERNLTMAASIASRGANTGIIDQVVPGARQAADLVEDLGISFFTREGPMTAYGGGRTLSMNYSQAMELNKLAGGALFGDDFAEGGMRRLLVNAGRGRTSPFVNLQLEINEAALDDSTLVKLRSALLETEGISERMISDIDTFFGARGSGDPLRITVGSLRDEAAERVINAIEMTAFSVHDAKRMYMPLISETEQVLDDMNLSVLQTGPVMIGNSYTPEELLAIKTDVENARNLTMDLSARSETSQFAYAERAKQRRDRIIRGAPPSLSDQIPFDIGKAEYRRAKEAVSGAVRDAYATGGDFLASKGVAASAESGARILKRATLPTMVAGALGLYIARKRNETTKYGETFEMGDTISNGYYSGGDTTSADPIHHRVRPSMSPLATANLVFDNYDNRIGHTRPPGR